MLVEVVHDLGHAGILVISNAVALAVGPADVEVEVRVDATSLELGEKVGELILSSGPLLCCLRHRRRGILPLLSIQMVYPDPAQVRFSAKPIET